jgi:hypothetical protein
MACMSAAMTSNSSQYSIGSALESPNSLLQLPGPVLDVVLQQLDPCSHASAAASCNVFSTVLPARIINVTLHCSRPETLESFTFWLGLHSINMQLTKLELCSVIPRQHQGQSLLNLYCLPCSQLRELILYRLKVQLERAGGSSGVLHDCTRLTALHLQGCIVQDADAAFAAIAALPELQCLTVTETTDAQGRLAFPQLQHPLQLTQLSLNWDEAAYWPQQDPQLLLQHKQLQLSQLPGLVNLDSSVCHNCTTSMSRVAFWLSL